MTPREKKRLKKKEINNNLKKEISNNNSSKTYTNYLLTVMYDGSTFGGYAKQKFSNTIEEQLNLVIDNYFTEHIKLISASRTDAKVHALAQKIMFKTNQSFSQLKFLNYLNETLPKSIKIEKLQKVANDFHCRYAVVSKTYCYKINTTYDLFSQNYAYFWEVQTLDIARINSICALFIGTYDFNGFCNPKKDAKDTTRTIYDLMFIQEDTNHFYFKITGNGFLYNMIRILISAILYWYKHNTSLNEIKTFLLSGKKFELNSKMPPQGLYLWEINYEK